MCFILYNLSKQIVISVKNAFINSRFLFSLYKIQILFFFYQTTVYGLKFCRYDVKHRIYNLVRYAIRECSKATINDDVCLFRAYISACLPCLWQFLLLQLLSIHTYPSPHNGPLTNMHRKSVVKFSVCFNIRLSAFALG